VTALASSASPRQILTVSNLSKSFGGVHAVADVSLCLDEGELRCLIGPNGAGKSTLFRLIMGLERADSGFVKLGDRDITRLQPFQRVRRGLSTKYQTTRVFGRLTVAQNVLMRFQSAPKAKNWFAGASVCSGWIRY
jgi:branched-chain amino acid transport system ATP-binding protein